MLEESFAAVKTDAEEISGTEQQQARPDFDQAPLHGTQISTREPLIHTLESLPPPEVVEARLLKERGKPRLQRERILVALTPAIIAFGKQIADIFDGADRLSAAMQGEGRVSRRDLVRSRSDRELQKQMSTKIGRMRALLERAPKRAPLPSGDSLCDIHRSEDVVSCMHAHLHKNEIDFERLVMASGNQDETTELLKFYFVDDRDTDWEAVTRSLAMTRLKKSFAAAGIVPHNIPSAATHDVTSAGPMGLTFLLRAANRQIIPKFGCCLHYLPNGDIGVSNVVRRQKDSASGGEIPFFMVETSPDAAEQLRGYFASFNTEVGGVLLYPSATSDNPNNVLDAFREGGAPHIAELTRTYPGSPRPTIAHEKRHAANHLRFGDLSYAAERSVGSAMRVPIDRLFTAYELPFFGAIPQTFRVRFEHADELSAFAAGAEEALRDPKSHYFQEFALLITTMMEEGHGSLCHRFMEYLLFEEGGIPEDEWPIIASIQRLERCFKAGALSPEDALTITQTQQHLAELAMTRVSDVNLLHRVDALRVDS